MQIDDRELLARTLQAEAGNQGVGGLLDVGSVIMNRVGGSGGSLRNTILKPGQFSAWNSFTGYAGGEQGQDMAKMKPDARAYMVADNLLSGDYTDATGGATHYYNPSISNPSWGAGAGGNWTKRGDHVFGRADDQPAKNIPTGGPQMMQPKPQSPQGLLSNQATQRRGNFGDTLAALAPALGRMGVMGLDVPAQAVADRRFARRDQEQKTSKTIEALSRMNTPQAKQALEYLSAGGDPVSALKIAFEKPKPGFEAADVVAARKEFTSNQAVKKFQEQGSAYGRLLASAKDPSGAGDLALIFNYMKVLDPGSTVREGEFATAQNAGGIDDSVVGLYNSIVNGKLLSSAQRDDFADRATRLYSDAEAEYNNVARQYEGFARKAGLPVDQVIPNFSYSGNRYESPLEFRRPAAPAGVSEADWTVSWASMTDDERQEFINAGSS